MPHRDRRTLGDETAGVGRGGDKTRNRNPTPASHCDMQAAIDQRGTRGERCQPSHNIGDGRSGKDVGPNRLPVVEAGELAAFNTSLLDSSRPSWCAAVSRWMLAPTARMCAAQARKR